MPRFSAVTLPIAAAFVLGACGNSGAPDAPRVGTLRQPEVFSGLNGYILVEEEWGSSHRSASANGMSTSDERDFTRMTVQVVNGRAFVDASHEGSQETYARTYDSLRDCYQESGSTHRALGAGRAETEVAVDWDEEAREHLLDVAPPESLPPATTHEYHWTRDCGVHFTDWTGNDQLDYWTFIEGRSPGEADDTYIAGDATEEAFDGVSWYHRYTSWVLSKSAEDVVLVVDIPAYDSWRPEGGEDERTRGNTLEVSAFLETMSGESTPLTADTIEFELVDVSRVPGVAMNWPPKERATSDLDLRFEQALNPDLHVDDSGLRATTPRGLVGEATVVLSSFDFGGHAVLVVTAHFADGTVLKGHLDGSALARIRLPKRAPGSLVADGWKRARGASGLADTDDGEASPEGDGHAGDGFTLYEEYRGFRYGTGERLWTDADPRRRDLFVAHDLGAEADDGFALAEQASGLRIRPDVDLALYQANMTRVMNFNVHPLGQLHRTDQHMLTFFSGHAADDAIAQSSSGLPGTPRDIHGILVPTAPAVQVNRLAFDPRTKAFRFTEVTPWTNSVAHELFHGANVYHHGEGDPALVEWHVVDGALVEMGASGNRFIDVHVEHDGTVLTPSMLAPHLPKDIYVARPGAEHSGDDRCLMRYAAADAVEDPAVPFKRWVFWPREPEGTTLCTSHKGTGINAAGRKPHPRHGDAPKHRGNCAAQLCINDFYNHAGR